MNPFYFFVWMYLTLSASSRERDTDEPSPMRRDPEGDRYVPRPQSVIEQDIAIVLAGKIGADEAAIRLSELRGEQAEAVLSRVFSHPEPTKFCDMDLDILPRGIALAAGLSTDAAQTYLARLFDGDTQHRRRAATIVQSVRTAEALESVQSTLVRWLNEGPLERRKIALSTLKAPYDRLFHSQRYWYEHLAKYADGIASALDCDLGDETESFQHSIFDLIARLPSNRDVAGVRAKKLTASSNEAFRAGAVWCRVTYLCLNDHAALNRELLVYMNDTPKVRSAACAAITDARMDIPRLDYDLSQLAVSLLSFVMERVWGDSTEYHLVPVICKLPCELPCLQAIGLERESRARLLSDHHFAMLMRKVRRDWDSVAFVSACEQLLSLEREQIPILGQSIGCPWAIAISILETADAKQFFATLDRMSPCSKAEKVFERLFEIAKYSSASFYRVRVVGLGDRAWVLLAKMASAPRVMELLWSHVDDTILGDKVLEAVFSNNVTQYDNLLRLLAVTDESPTETNVIRAARHARSMRLGWWRRRAMFHRLAAIYLCFRNDEERYESNQALVSALDKLNRSRLTKFVARFPFAVKPPQEFRFH